MSTSTNDLSYVLWVCYALPIPLILLLVPRSRSEVSPPLAGRAGAYLAVVAVVGFLLGVVSAKGAFWLCNCGSTYVFPSGNNHFDEDVAVVHVFSLTMLFPCYLHCLWIRERTGSLYLFGSHVLIVALLLLFLWTAVGWTPPGCAESLWH